MHQKPTIGLIGLGRMGQSISTLMGARSDLAFKGFSRLHLDSIEALKQCDVAIEFTTSEAAPEVIRTCLEQGIAVVSGTTGWHEYHLDSILHFCKEHHGKFLHASNFSIGMNIVFALNEKLAEVLSRYPAFQPSLKEIHHVHKKDMPSGTAYTLLEGIFKQQPRFTNSNLNDTSPSSPNLIPIEAIREGEVKGFHEVTWNSGMEKITLGHEAFDRSIFAAGAIEAALWLIGQREGIYTMKDLIQL